jgi:HAD superfamily hydrolase (TIGR01509 family)
MAAPSPRGIVFDFDGVLADTEHLHLRAYQDVFARRGWTLDEQAYFGRYLGYDDEDLLRLYARDQRIAMDDVLLGALLDEKTAVYERRIETGDVLYPSAPGVVRALAPHFKLAIASGSRRPEILHIVRAAGLMNMFTTIVSADDVMNSKPSPEPYLAAAQGLGLDPRACLAIEDSHWGIDSARTAGLRTIALTTTSPASVLRAANRIVSRIDDVTLELIEDVFGV